MRNFYERMFFAADAEAGTEPEEEVEVEVEEEQPEPEEVEGGATEGEEEQVEKPSRGETRYQKLANERQTEREARIRAEARAEALEQAQQQPRYDNGDAARIRAEKMALMEPSEREIFLLKEASQRMEQTQTLTSVQMADYRDEAKYDAQAALNNPRGKAYAKHKDWIENALAQERKAGRNPSREALLRLKLGDDLLNAKPSKTLPKEKVAAAERVAAAQGKPVSGRGDAGSKKKDDDSLESLKARILAREAKQGNN